MDNERNEIHIKRYPAKRYEWSFIAASVDMVKGRVDRSKSKTTWGYIVKRLSAYGGCLGSQRR